MIESNVYTVLIGVVGLMTAVTSLVTAVVVLLAAAIFRSNLQGRDPRSSRD